ncbi:MAG: glycosyltransferase family 2 protein [Ruminococcus sp.]|nr:glycosyltransferase family 2 protein [Ruminococcus sp.]
MNRNQYDISEYTFVLCAYGESPYLEECILSLLKQSVPAKIIVVTSTPNGHIEALTEKYRLEYYVNNGPKGIAEDWNFGYRKADAKIVTLAHQDDIYEPDFARKNLEKINRARTPLISFADYGEIREGKRVTDNKLLNVKRIMLLPLRAAILQRSRFVRRRILSFGSPICCPSVTYVKENLPDVIFEPGYRSNVDWQAWEKISRRKGSFVYCTDILMFHRIHEDSATTAIIADHDRSKEDYAMFCKFWPKKIAGMIEFFYRNGEKSNEI